jgi:hypothetical protein
MYVASINHLTHVDSGDPSQLHVLSCEKRFRRAEGTIHSSPRDVNLASKTNKEYFYRIYGSN